MSMVVKNSVTEKLQRITVCGLGKLGTCVAACLAARGFEVVGIDIDRQKVESLRKGIAPVEEPKLQEMIESSGGRLSATSDFSEALATSQACFFVIPTPSLPDGSFSNEHLLKSLHEVAKQVRQRGHGNFLFVINSTVTPGSCEGVLKPLLEQLLQGKCGQDFGLCYNPEFIALGDVIRGLLEPDLVLIGESDTSSGDRLKDLYSRLTTNGAPVERMSLASAELAKISLNCAVTMKISFANQLSAVCAKFPNADARAILKAIGRDRRIGHEYLKLGLGFGGPCFPRDNRLFQYTAESLGLAAPLARATDQVNENVNLRLLDTVLSRTHDGRPVGILGLAYKPFTSVIDCSPGVWLCQTLAERGHRVFAHDYQAGGAASSVFTNGQVTVCKDPAEVLQKDCSAFVITCPWPGYRELFQSSTARHIPSGSVVIDPWGVLDPAATALDKVAHVTGLD
jgi:UDPglucose 6-dehydrogenase